MKKFFTLAFLATVATPAFAHLADLGPTPGSLYALSRDIAADGQPSIHKCILGLEYNLETKSCEGHDFKIPKNEKWEIAVPEFVQTFLGTIVTLDIDQQIVKFRALTGDYYLLTIGDDVAYERFAQGSTVRISGVVSTLDNGDLAIDVRHLNLFQLEPEKVADKFYGPETVFNPRADIEGLEVIAAPQVELEIGQ